MRLAPLLPEEAIDICKWKYEGIYTFYNPEESPESLRELLDGSYYSVRGLAGEFIGFFCFGYNAQVPAGREMLLYTGDRIVDIGLGMKPKLTGRGLGSDFLAAGLKF